MIRQFAALALAAAASSTAPALAQEASQAEIMAVVSAIIRERGMPCTAPSAVRRDDAASRPDEPVYDITCAEGGYTVRVVPDMAAVITRNSGQ